MTIKTPRLAELERSLRDTYSPYPKDENEKVMDAIETFLEQSMIKTATTKSILVEAAKMIHRSFEFQFIAIALRDKNEDVYRYRIFQGIPPATEQTYKKITYSSRDLYDPVKFPCIKVSRLTAFYMIEDNPMPKDEEGLYRMASVDQPRKSNDDFHEGDYIVTVMPGLFSDLVGWIEVSVPRTGKFPKKETLIWIELMASLLVNMIYQKEYAKR